MNAILILLDTLRRDFLSPYGSDWLATSNMQRLADMGTTFDRAYLGSYPCMPARRDLWTGRFEFPWRGWGPLQPTDQTLPATLGAAGVHTGLVTDHYHLFEHGSGNYHFPFDSWEFIRGQEKDAWALAAGDVTWPGPEFRKVHRGWRQYWANTARWRRGLDWVSEEPTFAAQTFRAAANWLEANRAATPFFLLIDCFDPHEPFDPPAPYRQRYEQDPGPERMLWPIYGQADRYTAAELRDIRGLYAGEVALVDTWLGYFLDRLERLGQLDDTVIILTTDHGHLFGEHGMIGKPSTTHGDSNMYQEVAAVPFIVYYPGMPGGQRRQELIQPVDVFPTIAAALGVQAPDGLHGHDLAPLLSSGTDDGSHGGQGSHGVLPLHEAATAAWPRRHAFFAKYGESINVTDGRYTLFQWPPAGRNTPLYWYGAEPPSFLKPRGVGPYEPCQTRYPIDWVRGPMQTGLFDVETDPTQQHDLATERPEVVRRLQDALREWLTAIDAPEEQSERLGLT